MKMNSAHVEKPEKVNKENISKLISMFEVKRPKKSYSTLRKTKSVSSLLTACSSDEEESKCHQRKASSKHSPQLKEKNKRRTKSTRSTSQEDYSNNKIKHIIEDIEKTNKMVDDFGTKLKMKRHRNSEHQMERHNHRKEIVLQHSFDEPDRGINYKELEDNQRVSCVQSLDRRFFKNDSKRHSSIRETKCKELISRKRNKEIRQKSFTGAKSETEIESLRKDLVNEINSTVEKLKVAGFIDDDENSNVNNNDEEEEYAKFEDMVRQLEAEEKWMKASWAQRVNIRRELIQQPTTLHQFEPDLDYSNEQKVIEVMSNSSDKEIDVSVFADEDDRPHQFGNMSDDEFGESLAEDLEENGSYFVEAYNDEGKELIIVEIAVERRAVDLHSLQAIAESIKNSDMVFQQNADKSLNVIDNPKEFVSAESLSSGCITNPESKRSTVYSIASRDSEAFDTDDEGISLGNVQKHDDEDPYNNFRRETFCDIKGIVRIERIGYPGISNGNEEAESPLTPVNRTESFTQKGTLSYIIDEIKTTERKYVEDLNRVVTKYMPYIEEHTPTNLIGRQCYIFGNIDKLYHKQKEFLVALENCDETVDEVVKTFISFENLFKLYPRYFKNKPKADIVLKEFSPIIKQSQAKFEERLDLSSYLLTPLQRLGKYKLFLENMEKQLNKLDMPTDNVQKALDIIKGEMSKGNDFVAIESIENSPINKEDYGSFKMREKFIILKPRRFEAMVFLFENIVVFTVCDARNMDTYCYHASIKMMDLRIATYDEDLTIHLTDFTKSKRMSRADRYTYILDAKTPKVKETWRKAIEAILWQQLQKVKENTLKMYQSAWTTKRHKASRKAIKSTGSSIFYIE